MGCITGPKHVSSWVKKMGKASSKWVKGLLHMKKDKKENMDKKNDKKTTSSCLPVLKPSIMAPSLQLVSSKNISPPTTIDDHPTNYILSTPEKEHAVAVADVALAVAEAAVAVIRLTNHGRKGTHFDVIIDRERWAAAIKIQSVFRAYLARKALRALKGLVKFQALIKGFLVRKRAAATIYSMQALLRAQAAILSQRARRSFPDHRVTRHRKSTVTLFDVIAGRERWAAAIKIQSVFRAYLAKKALRALRGLVKFQALVRGFLVRKRTVETLYSMQSLLRVQVSILSQRARRSFTDHRVITRHRKSTAGKALRALRGLVKFQALVRGFLVRKRAAVILHSIQALFRAQAAILSQRARCSFTDHRVTRHRKSIERFDQETYSRFAKSNRSIAPTTRAQSVCGDGYIRPYSNNHPSYMANTQPFSAKQRCHSAPKQKPEFLTKRRGIEIMA